MEGIPSFIKIGGAVSEKHGRIGQTFVVLYIGFSFHTPLDCIFGYSENFVEIVYHFLS